MKKVPLLAGLKKLRTIILGADAKILGGRFNELFLGGLSMADNAESMMMAKMTLLEVPGSCPRRAA